MKLKIVKYLIKKLLKSTENNRSAIIELMQCHLIDLKQYETFSSCDVIDVKKGKRKYTLSVMHSANGNRKIWITGNNSFFKKSIDLNK
jgi:hypothetical protein